MLAKSGCSPPRLHRRFRGRHRPSVVIETQGWSFYSVVGGWNTPPSEWFCCFELGVPGVSLSSRNVSHFLRSWARWIWFTGSHHFFVSICISSIRSFDFFLTLVFALSWILHPHLGSRSTSLTRVIPTSLSTYITAPSCSEFWPPPC